MSWVLIIIAGVAVNSGRAIDTSLSFRAEAECRAAQKAIADMDYSDGPAMFRPGRATCVQRTKD